MAAGKCKAAYHADEWHGYGCEITDGACMFLYPNSKACAEQYGEGPDAVTETYKEYECDNFSCIYSDFADCNNSNAEQFGEECPHSKVGCEIFNCCERCNNMNTCPTYND